MSTQALQIETTSMVLAPESPHHRSRSSLAWLANMFFAAIAMAGLLAAGCQPGAKSTPEPSNAKTKSTPTVHVTEAEVRAWPETVRVQGTLLPQERSVVGTRVAGIVSRVEVDLGSTVHKGDLLVGLDETELAISVRQAEAQLAQACAIIGIRPDKSENDLDRESAPPVLIERAALDEASAAVARGKQLLERRAITNEEFQRLEAIQKAADARYKSALNNVGSLIALVGVRRAELSQAKQQLADAHVVAPYDGVVEERHVSPGEHVDPSDPVVTLVRADILRFKAGVPEREAPRVRAGQPVRIFLEGEKEPLTATVTRVSPAITVSSRSLLIEADVANPKLLRRTGLFAEADVIVNSEKKVVTVPESAVTEFAGIEKIWVVREGQGNEVPVRTGRRHEGRIEILDGLASGELVVADVQQGHAGSVTVVRGQPAPKSGENERKTAASSAAEDRNGSE